MEMVTRRGIATGLVAKSPASSRSRSRIHSSWAAIVQPGIRVDAAEERPSDTASDAVLNADLIFNDDLAARIRRHQQKS